MMWPPSRMSASATASPMYIKSDDLFVMLPPHFYPPEQVQQSGLPTVMVSLDKPQP